MSNPKPIWRSLAEHEGDPAFMARVAEEFPGLARVLAEGTDRRQVLKLMGASLVLGLGGCDPGDPKGQIIPGIKAPAGVVPGVENQYATASVLDGYATGIRVRHQDGRPMQVVGNPDHPASLGAADPIAQARILSLYDPDRSHGVTNRNQAAGWAAFLATFEQRRAGIAARKGEGLSILTGTVTSPTLAAQLAQLQQLYPQMRWQQWQAINRDAVRQGAMLAYGRPVDAIYRLDQAEVILTIDSDLLSTAPGHLRHARDFAARRNPVAGAMSRLYAVESTPDVTGILADHRIVAGPREIHGALTSLAAVILRNGTLEPGTPGWIAPAIADLKARSGAALIHIGPDQPAESHALVHALNEALGGRGKTFDLIEPVEASPIDQAASLRALIADMAGGRVEDLLILGENPVFTASAAFAEALKQVPFSVSLGLEPDETAELTTWHLPEAHSLEAWSDARAHDGTVTILQPQVQPLFGGHSAHEVLALLAGNGAPDGFKLVRQAWSRLDDAAWHQALASGVITGTARKLSDVRLSEIGEPTLAAPIDRPITLLLRPDPYLWDGRFANSAWLQELPRPLTKLVWDNPLLIAPALARELGVGNGDLVKLSAGGKSLSVPVWIQPGQAADCVTAYRGFGRRQVGAVGKNAGFDFLVLGDGALSIEKASGMHALATTEHHNPLDAAPAGVVRHGTAAAFAADPKFLQTPDAQASLYPPQPVTEMAWGMSIDLNTCIGCNACVTACQAENNVPVVGKDEVLREREMHWLRIDRYYEGPVEAPRVLLQPMLCMHCEEAPCEVVCPVGATMHDAEGLNVMVYNRCVGTRFCSNNCPYKVRRFNYFAFARDEVRAIQSRNQEVSVRARGVMEKCSFCIQRIAAARIDADKEDRAIRDGEVVTACQAACPTRAISFGNIRDGASVVAKRKASPLAYALLDDLNTKPRVTYEGRIRNANPAIQEGSA